jgi:hypothetical protein
MAIPNETLDQRPQYLPGAVARNGVLHFSWHTRFSLPERAGFVFSCRKASHGLTDVSRGQLVLLMNRRILGYAL